MTRTLLASSCALMIAAVAACGGGDDDAGGEGSAVDHVFQYGAPASATPTEASVLSSGVANVVSLRNSPAAASAVALASFTTVTSTLLGAPGSAMGRAAAAALDKPAGYEGCVTVTPTTLTYDHCETLSAGSSSVIDGSFTFGAGGADLVWELHMDIDTDSAGYRSSISLLTAGNVSTTATGMKGQFRSESTVSVSGKGYNFAYAVSEALLVDLSFQGNPACVVSGTLEARRVWTRRPTGAPAASYLDRGAKITWTGCNQATIARSR